jgi:hypothetical protein
MKALNFGPVWSAETLGYGFVGFESGILDGLRRCQKAFLFWVACALGWSSNGLSNGP